MLSTLAQQYNPDPEVKGSSEDGWQWLPDVADATVYPEWIVDSDKGAYLPVYQTASLDRAEVTRAVIILQGKERACWSRAYPLPQVPLFYSLPPVDWNAANNALYNVTYNDATIKRSQISIMGPCFLAEADLNAGAAQDGQLLWGNTTWISGQRNVAPDSVSSISSFDVLDALVSYYMDRSVYPNLKVLVIGGHSAGGQMAQRYATLRISTANDDRLHFWIANPASLCWLTPDRLFPNDQCEGFDKFKYGLQSNFPAYASKDARVLGRDGIIKRYYSRTLNYAWGLTQGRTRLERGQNFIAMLEDMGGIPNITTVDWVPGINHSTQDMMASDAGIDKVCTFIPRARHYN
ncbi:hypothetical protein DFS33DRAFT_1434599 [Desarmillaria ectypa]|nr:hypothetical protein DFS33DRAFT_1434599 [Desarmillaria ectypa]